MSGVNGPDIAAVYQLLTEVALQVGDIVRRLSEHDGRFEQIDRRFEQIDRRFEQIDRRLNRSALRAD